MDEYCTYYFVTTTPAAATCHVTSALAVAAECACRKERGKCMLSHESKNPFLVDSFRDCES